MTDRADQADRTLWVGNLDPKVTEEILFELFLQAGPVNHVTIAKGKDGSVKPYGFVDFKHDVSVPYSMQLMGGLPLFGRPLRLQFRSGSKHQQPAPQPMMQSPQHMMQMQGGGNMGTGILGSSPSRGGGGGMPPYMQGGGGSGGGGGGRGADNGAMMGNTLAAAALMGHGIPGNVQNQGLLPATPHSQGGSRFGRSLSHRDSPTHHGRYDSPDRRGSDNRDFHRQMSYTNDRYRDRSSGRNDGRRGYDDGYSNQRNYQSGRR